MRGDPSARLPHVCKMLCNVDLGDLCATWLCSEKKRTKLEPSLYHLAQVEYDACFASLLSSRCWIEGRSCCCSFQHQGPRPFIILELILFQSRGSIASSHLHNLTCSPKQPFNQQRHQAIHISALHCHTCTIHRSSDQHCEAPYQISIVPKST